MCSTGSTSSAGSPKASPTYDERYNAATPTGVPQRSSRTCIEPASPSSADPTTFTEAHQAHLDRLFDAHPRLHTASTPPPTLSKSSTQAKDLDQANQALRRFADLYTTGQIPEYRQVVDTVIAWEEGILAYHTTRRSTNGPIEGTNNLLQVLRRVAHGFTNTGNFAARGILIT